MKKTLTREALKAQYPHRIAMDPDTCPACCGDGRTTDRMFGGAALDVNAPSTVYDCLACEVWTCRHDLAPAYVHLPEGQAANLLRYAESIVPQVMDRGNTRWTDGGRFWRAVCRGLERALEAGALQRVWTKRGMVTVYCDGRIRADA